MNVILNSWFTSAGSPLPLDKSRGASVSPATVARYTGPFVPPTWNCLDNPSREHPELSRHASHATATYSSGEDIGGEFRSSRPRQLSLHSLTEEYRASEYVRKNAYNAHSYLDASLDCGGDLYDWVNQSTTSATGDAISTHALWVIDEPEVFWPCDAAVASTDEYLALLRTAVWWQFDRTPERILQFYRSASFRTGQRLRSAVASNAALCDHVFDPPLFGTPESRASGTLTPDDLLRLIDHDDPVPPTLSLSLTRFWPYEIASLCKLAVSLDRLHWFTALCATELPGPQIDTVFLYSLSSGHEPYALHFLALAHPANRAYLVSTEYLWAATASVVAADEIVAKTPEPFLETAWVSAAKARHISHLRVLHQRDPAIHLHPRVPGAVCASAAEGGDTECLAFVSGVGWELTAQTTLCAAAKGHLACLELAVSLGCPWHKHAVLQAALNGHVQTLKFAHGASHTQITPWIADTILGKLGAHLTRPQSRYQEVSGCSREGGEEGGEGGEGDPSENPYLECYRYIQLHKTRAPRLVQSLMQLAGVWTRAGPSVAVAVALTSGDREVAP